MPLARRLRAGRVALQHRDVEATQCQLDTKSDHTELRHAVGYSGEQPVRLVETAEHGQKQGPWGPPAIAAIQAAAPGWRLVQIGQSAGAEVPLASAVIRGKMGELYGYTDFTVPTNEFRVQYLRLVGHAAAGEIVFDIETYPLERVAEAWERQADGANAKIVVTLT
jgi:NADPH2:quinone reductase